MFHKNKDEKLGIERLQTPILQLVKCTHPGATAAMAGCLLLNHTR